MGRPLGDDDSIFSMGSAALRRLQQGDHTLTVLVQAISRLTRTDVDSEPLKTVLIFSGIGLLLSLLAIETYGLDLSVGFF